MPEPAPDYRYAGTPTDRPSPLQNRVLPTGEIVADPARGRLMGNRGCIHQADRRLGVSRWRSPMWISCVLRWGNVRRDVMPTGRWTALFFLDEATALAAGHRPCGYCRRLDHLAFGEAWRRARGLPKRPKAHQLDLELHRERVDRTRRKLSWSVPLGELPSGAMVLRSGRPALVVGDRLLPWSLAGYQQPLGLPARTVLEVLTPPRMVGALTAGYQPLVHPSAGPTGLRIID
jgi:hypothetical protein